MFSASSSSSDTTPSPLQFRDVFVLTRSCDLHDDDVTDDSAPGVMTSTASGVIQGLRAAKIPVRVLRNYIQEMSPGDSERWGRDVRDVAAARSDAVTVAWWGAVRGLERKVVVWLRYRRPGIDDRWTDTQVELVDRLHAVSRCTTQLIVVDVLA